ncbi:hypothetical protein L3X38_019879 [Prunus dulcis]|uniref:Uncharacterized protein n=1 Tax=Prunus dulcis TaxID=3755 RepID=A0AAD4WBS4_PRUDU|nr:hypothetical protein L3X38_019879 [Prunus dulcis]
MTIFMVKVCIILPIFLSGVLSSMKNFINLKTNHVVVGLIRMRFGVVPLKPPSQATASHETGPKTSDQTSPTFPSPPPAISRRQVAGKYKFQAGFRPKFQSLNLSPPTTNSDG